METKVLTQEELQSLKAIQEKRIQLTEQFGLIEMRIQEMGLQKEFLKEELKKLQQEEIDYGKQMSEKYGTISVNPETGEITKVEA